MKKERLDCPYDFTSRCTMGRCDCKPKEERMYSEEEVLDLWNWLNDGFIIRKSLPTREELIGWFEQFKKK